MNALMFSDFDEYIQENRYSKHSFINLLNDPNVNKTAIKNWAIQKYFQTFLQNCVFSTIHANSMLYEDIRQYQMYQLVGEETKICDGSDSHYNLMKRFAKAMGATEKEIKQTTPAPEVTRFVNYLLAVCQNNHPILAMLSIYVNESQTPESVKKMYLILKERFALTDDALEWFIVHSIADVDHANHAKKIILKYINQCEDFYKRGWKIVTNGVQAWTHLQNYYAQLLMHSS